MPVAVLPAVEFRYGAEEVEVAGALDEVDDVAAGAAPEAVEPVGHPVHRQRGCRVLVEGAAADEPVPARVQLDAGRGDDVGQRVPGSDGVDVDRLALGVHSWTSRTAPASRSAASMAAP